jgi:hypothetical protein
LKTRLRDDVWLRVERLTFGETPTATYRVSIRAESAEPLFSEICELHEVMMTLEEALARFNENRGQILAENGAREAWKIWLVESAGIGSRIDLP